MKCEKWPPAHMLFSKIFDDKLWINLAWPKGIDSLMLTHLASTQNII